MTEKFEKDYDNFERNNSEASSITNPSTKENLQKIKWLERALRKGKISQAHYDSESKTIKEAIDKAELANMQKEFEEFSGRPNPTMTIKNGHIVINLICPRCGTEGENTHGRIQFKILGKDEQGYIYFECPNCKEHLQYDPVSGCIKTRKGLLGFLFGRFS
jgi:predicted RNA-binding Zn-ribbon protein involved in translation (DUF1610 family)